jgi:hypothetical protein
MAKRKKRNATTLVSLLLALTVLIIVYYWYGNYDAASDQEAEVDQTIALATLDTEQLSSMHYIKDDADITLMLQEEVWVSKEDPDRPINQDYVANMINVIDEVKADRLIVEAPENLADYGLNPAVAYLKAEQEDGVTVTVQIGNEVSNGDGYYGLVNDSDTVYLLPIEYGTALQYTDNEMTAVEESPEITAENIFHIDVVNRDGEEYELKYIEDNGLDKSGSDMYSWEILQPYGEGYSADSSKMTDIQANYTTFDFINCIDYKGDDLSLYGLENPAATITIGYYETRTESLAEAEVDPETGEEITEKTYYDPQEYKVYIGNKDEEGDYYIRREGSNIIYTISPDTIDKMLVIDAFAILNSYVCIPNIDSVNEIILDKEGTTYTMNLKRATKENEDGEEETLTTYYFNGNEVEEDSFKGLYQIMISTQSDAQAKEEVLTQEVEPYLTLSYQLNDEVSTILTASFLPYDDSFFIVKKENDALFLVDKRKIEEIVAAVEAYTGTGE